MREELRITWMNLVGKYGEVRQIEPAIDDDARWMNSFRCELMESVKEFLDRSEYRYEIHPDGPWIALGFQVNGQVIGVQIRVHSCDEDHVNGVKIGAWISDRLIPMDRKDEVCDFVCRANERCKYGGLILNLRDSSLEFWLTILTAGSTVERVLMQVGLEQVSYTILEVHEKLDRVLRDGLTPLEALEE